MHNFFASNTLPESAVPSAWKLGEEEVVDPSMASSYITEPIAGPASARGSTYTYTYESHYEDPVITDLSPGSEYVEYPEDSIERHSTQTQK
uniref:NBS-LRR type resistance protein n=1 Tax=Steinernema glaseri TaxID=37863 RepID=A0A1I7Z548_9BILA